MIFALKLILIVIVCISFFGAVAETKPDLRQSMLLLCLGSMAAAVVTFIFV